METPTEDSQRSNNAAEKRPAEQEAANPAPKTARIALAGAALSSAGGAAGPAASAGSAGPAGGSPPQSRASPAAPLAVERFFTRAKAFVPPPGVSLDAAKKAEAAALAANTFTKKVVEKDNFRCFVQVYKEGAYWTLEENAWKEVSAPSYKLHFSSSAGLLILPSFDPESLLYKMIPFGKEEPTIRDSDNCGVYEMAAGSSLEWKFDREVNYFCVNERVSFIVVKIPDSPAACHWGHMTSDDVENIVRAKFFIGPDEKKHKPCWYNGTIVENERDSWKLAANAGEAMYTTLFNNYIALQSDYVKLARQSHELETNNSKIIKDHFDLHKAMTELQEKCDRMKNDNQNMAAALCEINKSMECAICLETLGGDAACSMGIPCGHVVHTECHEKQKKKGVCAQCQCKVSSWLPFHGFTTTCTALKRFDFTAPE